MGNFLRVASTLFVFVIISGQTIECFRNGTSARAPKNRKIKRNSANAKFSFDDDDEQYSFGQDYRYPTSKPSRGNPNAFAPLFNFPSGTKLSLTPQVIIPITMDSTDDVEIKTHLQAAFPITVSFKEYPLRGLFPMTDPFDHKTSSWNNAPASFENHVHHNDLSNGNNEQNQQRLLSRKLRDVDSISNTSKFMWKLGIPNQEPLTNMSFLHNNLGQTPFARDRGQHCPIKSFVDRRGILQKMELFVGSFIGSKDNPKSCLLRWACEMHQHSMFAGHYGLLGEGALLAFSVEELSRRCEEGSPNLNYLKPFIKAEIAGKSGNCFAFIKNCSHSLFT